MSHKRADGEQSKLTAAAGARTFMATPVPGREAGRRPPRIFKASRDRSLAGAVPSALGNLLKRKGRKNNLSKSMTAGMNRNIHYYMFNIYINLECTYYNILIYFLSVFQLEFL